MPAWFWAVTCDLAAIHRHQAFYNDEDRADEVVEALIDAGNQIVAKHHQEIVPGIRRMSFKQDVYLVTGSDDFVIVRVFSPGQDWLSWVKEAYPQ